MRRPNPTRTREPPSVRLSLTAFLAVVAAVVVASYPLLALGVVLGAVGVAAVRWLGGGDPSGRRAARSRRERRDTRP